MGNDQSLQADIKDLVEGLFNQLPLDEPWRDIDWNSRSELLEVTRGCNTGSPIVPKINLLLVGAVGSGKSSFCNTIDSILKGRISAGQEAMSSVSAAASITRKFRIMTPGGRRGGDVGFNICDTMGMEQDDGLNLDDLAYVFDGNVPDGFVFSSKTRITQRSRGFIPNPSPAMKMHCLAYVVDGTKVHLAPGEIRTTFRRLHELASSRSVEIVVLVTHIDEISSLVGRSIRNAYRCLPIVRIVNKITELTDIPLSKIYLVKNYCTETETKADIDVLNLTAVRRMLDLAWESTDCTIF